jgi:hypothetical protein
LRTAVARRADEAAAFSHRLGSQAAVDHDKTKPTVVFHFSRRASAVGFFKQICPRDLFLLYVAVGIDNTHLFVSYLAFF